MNENPVLRRKITERMKEWLSSDYKECLVIKGARQVGKSFSVEKFMEEHVGSRIKLDFILDPENRSIFRGDVEIDKIIAKIKMKYPSFDPVPGNTVIFLDEIESCPEARTLFKSFILDGRYRIIASGSLLGMNRYSDEDAEWSVPVGYERTEVMFSLDFEEFLWAYGIEQSSIDYVKERIHEKAELDGMFLNRFSEYFRLFTAVGGMPEAVCAYLKNHDVSDARSVQKKILSAYRDDIGRYAPQDSRDRVFAVFDSIPVQLAEENTKFLYNRIEGHFVPNYRTYSTALNWLCDSKMAQRCHNITEPKIPLEERVCPNIFKMYMCDTGLLLSSMDEAVVKGVLAADERVNKGGIGENIIAECLMKNLYRPLYFSTHSMEVDFVIVLGKDVTAIEVKSGNNNRSKSLRSIRDNYGVKRRIKMESSNIRVTDDGIEHYPLFAAAFLRSMTDRVDLRFGPEKISLRG